MQCIEEPQRRRISSWFPIKVSNPLTMAMRRTSNATILSIRFFIDLYCCGSALPTVVLNNFESTISEAIIFTVRNSTQSSQVRNYFFAIVKNTVVLLKGFFFLYRKKGSLTNRHRFAGHNLWSRWWASLCRLDMDRSSKE